MVEFVSDIFTDDLTGLTFVEDIRGFYYLVPDSSASIPANEFYIQELVVGYTWTDTSNFYSLPTPLISNKPNDSYLSFIVASQDFKNAYGTSRVGIFIDGTMVIALPFTHELNFKFNNPLVVPSGLDLEIKFQPFNRRSEVAITAGLYE